MYRTVKAGAAYFVLIFVVGFALGTLRVLVLAPRIGAFWSVVLELPLVLITAWIVCGWILRRFAVPSQANARLVMGGVAFGLLLLAETALSFFVFERGPAEYFASMLTAEGGLGVAGQVVYALFPVFRSRTAAFGWSEE